MRLTGMKTGGAGFSVVELLMTVTVTLTITAAAFHLLHKGQRVFRDQAVVIEMQETVRLLASQINDDIRMAGQGIPPGVKDIVLPGSGASRLNIRAGFSATEAMVTSPLPLPVASAVSQTLDAETTMGFLVNRQAFVWADKDWARVTIDSVSGSSRTIGVTPSVLNRTPLSFTQAPSISTDEAVAIYRDPALQTVRRTTATNTSDSNSPAWAPANELATNVTELKFIYYDAEGALLNLDNTEERERVRIVESRITVRASATLSNGVRPTYSVSLRTIPRNPELR